MKFPPLFFDAHLFCQFDLTCMKKRLSKKNPNVFLKMNIYSVFSCAYKFPLPLFKHNLFVFDFGNFKRRKKVKKNDLLLLTLHTLPPLHSFNSSSSRFDLPDSGSMLLNHNYHRLNFWFDVDFTPN